MAPDSIEKDTGQLLALRTVAEDGVTSGNYRFEPGDVLYSKIRPNLNKVALVDFAGLCSADMYALNVDPGRAVPQFIAYLLRGQDFLDYARSLSNRANIPKLNRGQLLHYRFLLPSVAEQRRIAAILDHADALRTKRRHALAHLDALTQSIFYAMFGDPDAATDLLSFKEVAGLSGGRNLVAGDSTVDSDYRVLKISAVTSGQFKAWESKPLPAGYVPPREHLVRRDDLLMSRANTTELVGAVAYVHDTPANLALPDKVWRFDWRNPESVPIFYHALFRTTSVRGRISRLSSGTGGSMKNVSKAKLESMLLPKVATSIQLEFADRVARVDGHRHALKRASAADDELFASLQARAFRGQL